jgi:hypothetical protein
MPEPAEQGTEGVRRPLLDIGRASSIDEVESNLDRLVDMPPHADLLLPSRLSERFLGGTAAVLQLIITWQRHCPDGRLRIHVSEAAEPEDERRTLERFLSTDHGLLGAAMTGSIQSRLGERDLSDAWRPLMQQRFGEMNEPDDLLHGPKGFLLCLDDSPFEAPRALYRSWPADAHEPPTLLGRKGFDYLSEVMARRLWPRGPGVSPDGLAALLHELFRNTHDWARRDVREVRYRPGQSVRGIRFERHNFELTQQAAMAAGQPAMQEYLSRPMLDSPDGRQRLVEVSIFDSGPGIAARRLLALDGDGPSDPDLEGRALLECLKKHVSTSPDSLGVGLHRALRALSDSHAFLVIRSGRLSMLRDFVATPYRPETDKDEPFLLDWMAGIGGVTARAPVAGASITALIPLRDRHVQTTL